MHSDCGNSSNNPPIFSPSSNISALLFALLPCVHESFLPLFRFLFLSLELSGQNLSGFTVPPINSSPKELLDTIFPDKDTLLKSLNFYGTLFRIPLLNTLSGLLQALHFYENYKDIFSTLFASQESFSREASAGEGASSDTLFRLLSGLGNMSPEVLEGLMGMSSDRNHKIQPASDTTKNTAGTTTDAANMTKGSAATAFDAASDSVASGTAGTVSNSASSEASGIASGNTFSGTFSDSASSGTAGTASDSASSETSETASDSASAETSNTVPNSASSKTAWTAPNSASSGAAGTASDTSPTANAAPEPENNGLFNSLYEMLTPEQQEIYQKLMQD